MSWKGYYEQCGSQHPMNFKEFLVDLKPGGRIGGKGSDQVGQFEFRGEFSPYEPKVRFEKRYVGKHTIYYMGNVTLTPPTIIGHWGFQPGSKDGAFKIQSL